MPNKRADDVRLRNVGIDDDLWAATKEKAAAEGITASEVIRRLLREWISR
jgi:hypothetical protein